MRSVSALLAIVAVVGAAAGTGCTGQSLPQTAQAGSTVVLPFAVSDSAGLLPLNEVAYGGTDFEDPQRGRLVVRLGGASGPALTTRFATLVAPPVTASTGPSAGATAQTLLLVADIPVDAPPGTHALALVRERTVGGVVEEVEVTPSPATLRILPHEVTYQAEGGALETATGTPTPTQMWAGSSWQPFLPGTPLGGPQGGYWWAIPEPSFGVALTGNVPPGSGSRFVGYVELEIEYPASKIDVLRVVAEEPAAGLVRWEDDGAGVLVVELVASSPGYSPTPGVGPIRVVFALDDELQPVLDLVGFDADVVQATDQFGEPTIQNDWSLNSVVTAIR